MLKPTEQSAVFTIAGLGVPLIDAIQPTREELDAGAALLRETEPCTTMPAEVRNSLLYGQQHIEQAKVSREKINAFWQEKGYVPKDKKNLSKEETALLAVWLEDILVAARDINRVAVYRGEPERKLEVRHIGGSMANKMHNISGLLGDRVSMHMLGALGNEDLSENRKRTLEKLSESRIRFSEFDGVSLGLMPVSHIIPAANDRVALKAAIDNLPEKLADKKEEVATFVNRPENDAYFIEGGDFSERKFGRSVFFEFVQKALNTDKPIIYSLPTDTSQVIGPGELQSRNRMGAMDIMGNPQTGFIGGNEEELVASFLGQKLEDKKTNPQKHKQQVENAIDVLQIMLRNKLDHISPKTPEPVAFISLGEDGAAAITANKCVILPVRENVSIVNTIGAGDGFFSGCFAKYIDVLQQPRHLEKEGKLVFEDHQLRYSEAFLKEMLDRGQEVAVHIIAQKSAQLPHAVAAQISQGNVPYTGSFVGSNVADLGEKRGVA